MINETKLCRMKFKLNFAVKVVICKWKIIFTARIAKWVFFPKNTCIIFKTFKKRLWKIVNKQTKQLLYKHNRGHRGRDHMVVGFTTTCAISAYHHLSCEFKSRWWRGVLDTTLCDKACQWLAAGQWFSTGTPVSSTNKTDCDDIAEILLKVALNTINRIYKHNDVCFSDTRPQ